MGLGAQKAGTSWVHAFLTRNAQADFGVEKEYHCFDALHLPEEAHFKSRRDISPLRDPAHYLRVLFKDRALLTRERMRRRLRADPSAYVRHFSEITKPGSGVRVTGDLTPEYGGLPHNVLGDVRQLMEKAGFDVRAVIIMRDPVERCLSASRMYLGRAKNPQRAQEYLDRGLKIAIQDHAFTQHAEMRTHYDRTLAEAEQVFGPGEIFYSFYEELFSEAETNRLTDWLGLAAHEADFETRVNSSLASSKKPDGALKTRIARHYRSVYEDMFRRFGEDKVRQLWPSAALLDAPEEDVQADTQRGEGT